MKKKLFLPIILTLIGFSIPTCKAEKMHELIKNIVNKNNAAVIGLLDRGTNPNVSYSYKAALLWAIENSNADVIKKFIQKNVNVNVVTPEEKSTPLMLAADKGDKDIVEILLKNDAIKKDINKTDTSGRSALFYAAYRANNSEILEKIITSEASINLPGKNKKTPLMNAASRGNKNNIQLLLEKNANQKKTDNQGNTALMICLLEMKKAEEKPDYPKYKDSLKLLAADEEVRKIEKQGKTASQLAASLGLNDEWYEVTGEYIYTEKPWYKW